MKHKLITFVGFKSSGKNTAAEALIPYGYELLSFADALKDACSSIFRWDRHLLEGITEESRIFRETVDEWWSIKLGIPNFTPRFAMQNLGTEIMRHNFNDKIWIYSVEKQLELIGDKPVAITDARFKNEIDMIKSRNGYMLRIQRGNDPNWMDIAKKAYYGDSYWVNQMQKLDIHPSEYSWIGGQIDETILNTTSIEELQKKVIEKCMKI